MRSNLINLLLIFFSVLCLRFFIYPPLMEYIRLKQELEFYKQNLEEVERERKTLKSIQSEIKEMKKSIKEIEEFSFPDIDILSVSRNSEVNECISEETCYIRKSYEVVFSARFDDIVSLFKDLSKSKNIVLVKKLEIERSEKLPKIKFVFETIEMKGEM